MLRTTLIYSGIIISLCAASLAPGSGINGKWQGTMQGPQGDMQIVFTFHVKADSLTGSVQGPMGNPVPITDGKVNGKKFSFDVSFGPNTIHHMCTVENDSTIAMKINGFQGNVIDVTLKRVKGDN